MGFLSRPRGGSGARALAAAALALSLAVPLPAFAADAGTVELGIEVDGSLAAPGGEGAVDLGIDVSLVRPKTEEVTVPEGWTGALELGIDVAYDRVVESGWTVRLDPNNGNKASALKGSVTPSRLTVPKDAEYDKACDDNGGEPPASWPADKRPGGVPEATIDAVKATRPGYEFAGWYRADASKPKDAYGRVALGEAADPDDPTSLGLFEDYDNMREFAGETLYAKWVVADEDAVRLRLEDAGDAGLWFWQGRGYTLKQPRADCELDPDFTIVASEEEAKALGALPLAIGQSPRPPASTQYFTGWGFEGTSGELTQRHLVTSKRVEDAEGARRSEYALGGWAFKVDYVEIRDGAPVWAGPVDAGDDGEPVSPPASTLKALFKTAHINVGAPLQVTFTKDRLVDGEHVPYEASDLEWTVDKTDEWVMSAEQSFTNKGDTDVWVSRIECTDAGTTALFANASKGVSLFSLGTSGVQPDQGKSILFGVAGDSRDVSVRPDKPGEWIVLKNKEGANTTKLWFGLNIRKGGFDRNGVVEGAGAGSSYAAGLANVKYTYSVAD